MVWCFSEVLRSFHVSLSSLCCFRPLAEEVEKEEEQTTQEKGEDEEEKGKQEDQEDVIGWRRQLLRQGASPGGLHEEEHLLRWYQQCQRCHRWPQQWSQRWDLGYFIFCQLRKVWSTRRKKEKNPWPCKQCIFSVGCKMVFQCRFPKQNGLALVCFLTVE